MLVNGFYIEETWCLCIYIYQSKDYWCDCGLRLERFLKALIGKVIGF